MKCLICNKSFNVKRKLSTLLKKEMVFVCDTCYKRYPINLNYQIIPIDNHLVHIYTLFDFKIYFKGDPFIIEYSKIFDFLNSKHKNELILLYKDLILSDKEFNNLEIISKALDKDIIILSYSAITPF